MRWIDLSKHRAGLHAFQLPDGQVHLILSGVIPHSLEWKLAERIGFLPTRSGRTMYRGGTKVEMREIAPIFPQAFVRDYKPDEIFLKLKGASPDTRTDANDLRTATPLGMNYLGQEVLAGATGRFIRNQDDTTLAENAATSPAIFLRGTTPSDMALCADGFVEAMVRGRTMRSSDMRRFAAVVHGEDKEMPASDPRLRQVQEAIEASLQRRINANHPAATPDAFRFAVQLVERQPTFNARTSSSVANQQYSTPLPMSIAAQHLLGDTTGLKVLEPTIGNASLVMSLPDGTDITGVEIDPSRVANANLLRSDIRVREGDILNTNLAREFDAVISNPPFGGLPKPVVFNGLRVGRLDHLIALKALDARKDEGRSVFIIAADRENVFPGKDGQLHGGSVTFFNWLADHYEIEDAIELNGSLYAKQGAEFPVRMVTVGKRRSLEEAARGFKSEEFRIKTPLQVVRSWEDLWTHVEEVSERLNVQVPEPIALTEVRVENDYQSPYIPASQISEPSSMIPRNLVAPLACALSAFENKYGQDVDTFVMDRLDMTREEMADAFAAEQVDSIALAIKRFEEGRGFILGDMTGQGKGRVIAGLARYAVQHDIPVVFLSEKANLFSDFWRDLQDISSEKLFRPMIMNGDAAIVDSNTNATLFRAVKKGELQAMMDADISLRETGYNLLCATYSQFNRDHNTSAKSSWLPAATKGALLVMDESHNAAGESNTAENIATAVEHAQCCLYSSATYAKGAKNMAAYAKAFPDSVSVAEIADTLEVGGEPLQEILSGLLAEDGAFIRREHDLSMLRFTTHIDSANLARNEKMSDQLAEILLAMSYLAGDVGHMVDRLQAEIKSALKQLGEEQRKGNRMGVSSVNFGSRLYNIMRQYMLAIKVEPTAEMAIKALKEGRKPVIVLEQTMEALLKETLFGNSPADALEGVADGEGADESGIVLPPAALSVDGVMMDALDFRDLLNRMLDRLSVITKRDGYGMVTQVHAVSEAETPEQAEAFAESVKRIRGMIARFPGLPVSPIDAIREKIEAAGFSFGEISGRSFQIHTRDGAMVMDESGKPLESAIPEGKMSVVSRPDNRLDAIYKFNNGETDAIVLTRAGSTGLSLHASEKFSDQRQREMIELQIANNVAERVQFFGRVNRRGQVCPPWITAVASGLPAEMRTMAMQNTKLRKLSANTQSNRNNAAELKDIPDILNVLGDKIAKDFLDSNPDIAMMLDIDMEAESDQDNYFVNRLTGRLCLLPVESQRRVLDELAATFEAAITDLEAKGENPLRAALFEWGAREESRTLLSGVEQEKYLSVFDQPVYLSKLAWEEQVDPLRSEKLKEMIDAGSRHLLQDERITMRKAVYEWEKDSFDCTRLLEVAAERFKFLMESSLPARFKTQAEALADKDPNVVKNTHARNVWLKGHLHHLVPGKSIKFTGIDGPEYGVITSMLLPEPRREALLGQYEVRVAVPGRRSPIPMTLNHLFVDEGYSPIHNNQYFGPQGKEMFSVFDAAPAGLLTRTRCVLTGNLYAAAEIASRGNSGRAAIYTDDKGVRHRAIILRGSIQQDDLLDAPIRLDGVTAAMRMVDACVVQGGGALQFSTSPRMNPDYALTINVGRDTVSASVPGSKERGGRWFANKNLYAITGEWSGTRQKMHVKFDRDQLEPFMEELRRLGDPIFVSSEHREVISTILREIAAEREAAMKAREQPKKAAQKEAA
jgi:hypothetical protein